MKKKIFLIVSISAVMTCIPCMLLSSCSKDDDNQAIDTTETAVQEARAAATTTDPSTLCPDNEHPHLIDLGIGVKWLCCNVGAAHPAGYGNYFAWGESKQKIDYWDERIDKAYKAYHSQYSWDSYIFYEAGTARNIGDDISGSKTVTRDIQYIMDDGKTKGTKQVKDSLDAAFYAWDKNYKALDKYKDNPWRMPKLSDVEALLAQCSSEWTMVNNIVGRKFTGPNGNSIFLPASGRFVNSSIVNKDAEGYYWTATIRKGEGSNPSENFGNRYAHYLCVSYKTAEDYYYWERYIGRTIRGVSE